MRIRSVDCELLAPFIVWRMGPSVRPRAFLYAPNFLGRANVKGIDRIRITRLHFFEQRPFGLLLNLPPTC